MKAIFSLLSVESCFFFAICWKPDNQIPKSRNLCIYVKVKLSYSMQPSISSKDRHTWIINKAVKSAWIIYINFLPLRLRLAQFDLKDYLWVWLSSKGIVKRKSLSSLDYWYSKSIIQFMGNKWHSELSAQGQQTFDWHLKRFDHADGYS